MFRLDICGSVHVSLVCLMLQRRLRNEEYGQLLGKRSRDMKTGLGWKRCDFHADN